MPYLVYWHWINSSDVCGYDVAGVIIDNGSNTYPTILDAFLLCSDTATNGWQRRTVDLHKYIGKTITLGFLAGNDEVSNPSNWYVDDISTQANSQASLATTENADVTIDTAIAEHVQTLAHRVMRTR